MIVPKRGDRRAEVSALRRPLLIIAILLLAAPRVHAQISGGGGGISGNGGNGGSGVQIGGDIGGTVTAPLITSLHLTLPAPFAQGGTNSTTSGAAYTALGGGTAGQQALPTAGVPGAFASLEQGKLDVLPGSGTLLVCSNATGVNPDTHWYSGTLSGNVSYPLAATGCLDRSYIIVTAVQDAAHTIAFTTTAAGGIEGVACPALGTTAGNQTTQKFQYNAARTSWVRECGISVPLVALALTQGGTACQVPPGPYASRDPSPVSGEQCFFTDGTCTAGSPIAGSGSGCWGTWISPNWMPGGNVTSSASGGVQIGGDIGGTVSTPLVTKIGGATISPLATQSVPCSLAQGCTNSTTAAGARTSLGLTATAIEPLPTAGVPGNFAPLIPKTDTLPTVSGTLACLNTSGVYPDTHWYSGLTPGTTTALTYTLPASGCVDNAIIAVTATQHGAGATADTVSFVAGAGSTLAGPTCPALGTASGNTLTCKFKWTAAQSQWTADNNSVTVPYTAPAVGISTFVDADSPYSPLSSDQQIDCNCSSGACQVNLPVAGNQALKRRYQIKNISASQICNVHPNATLPDLIDTVGGNVTLNPNDTFTVQERGIGLWDRASPIVTSAGMVAAGGVLNDGTNVNASAFNTSLGNTAAAHAVMPTVGFPGDFTSLVGVQYHALPITAGPNTLTCYGTVGTIPYEDRYTGTLGAVNVTEALPTSCADGSTITFRVRQGTTTTATFTVTGTKLGSETWSLGNATGDYLTLVYMWSAADSAWLVFNPGAYPAQRLPASSLDMSGSTVPPLLSWFGSGVSGAVTNPTLGGGENDYTTFVCNTQVNCGLNFSCTIRATVSITLNSGCILDSSGATVGHTQAQGGQLGGAGGGGGGGTALGAAGIGVQVWGLTTASVPSLIGGGSAGLAAGGAAGAGGAWSTAATSKQNQAIYDESPLCIGGGHGGAGGAAVAGGGSAGGSQGGCIWLIAPTVTINSGATVTVAGAPGVASTGNSIGAGGGGGGGFIGIAARTITQNGTFITTGGGAGGCGSFTTCGAGGVGGAGNSAQLVIP